MPTPPHDEHFSTPSALSFAFNQTFPAGVLNIRAQTCKGVLTPQSITESQ